LLIVLLVAAVAVSPLLSATDSAIVATLARMPNAVLPPALIPSALRWESVVRRAGVADA